MHSGASQIPTGRPSGHPGGHMDMGGGGAQQHGAQPSRGVPGVPRQPVSLHTPVPIIRSTRTIKYVSDNCTSTANRSKRHATQAPRGQTPEFFGKTRKNGWTRSALHRPARICTICRWTSRHSTFGTGIRHTPPCTCSTHMHLCCIVAFHPFFWASYEQCTQSRTCTRANIQIYNLALPEYEFHVTHGTQ